MNPETEFDVIVVGGGPAGAACSTYLVQRGIRVLLLEKSTFPRDKVCGDCLNPHVWNFFESLGIADEIRAANYRHVDRVRIIGKTGREVRMDLRATPAGPCIAIKRKTLDEILLNRARNLGAVVLERARLTDVIGGNPWIVRVDCDRLTREYRCRFLIGADGRNSIVARTLGAETKRFHPSRSPRRVGVQWHTCHQPTIGNEIRLYTFETGYCGIVNVDPVTANVAMVTDPNTSRLACSDFSQFLRSTLSGNSRFGRAPMEISPVNEIRITNPINPSERRLRSGRAFLVGDAHRTVEPFTGEGVSLALQDGVQVARKVMRIAGREPEPIHFRSQTSFWVNRVYSPVLRRHRATESLIAFASKQSWFARILRSAIIPDS